MQNLLSDSSACGACSTACSSAQLCSAGVCSPFFPASSGGISWTTTYVGTLNGSPFALSNSNTRVKFTFERSASCGGANSNQQLGTATGTIGVGSVPVSLSFTLSAAGTAGDSATVYFDNNLAGFVTMAAGAQTVVLTGTCVDGAAGFARLGTWPQTLAAFSMHTIAFYITSLSGAAQHMNSYVQLDLTLAPVT